MSWMDIKAKSEQRAKLIEDAGALLKKAHDEKRELTEEENAKFAEMHQDADKIEAECAAVKKQEAAERSMIGRESFVEVPEDKKEAQNRVFVKWLRYGEKSLTPEERAVSGIGVSVTGGGAEFVPDLFADQYVKKLQTFGGVRQSGARILNTFNGNDLIIPVLDDTGNTGELTAENSAVTDNSANDPVTSNITLSTYMYDSKMVRCSIQLLEDSAFPVEEWLTDALVERVGKITNAHFTTGTGSAQPQGVVTGSGLGKTIASTSAVTYNEMLDLKHSVDPAYREGAVWMFNDATLLALKKLTESGTGRPLWNGGNIALQQPATIDGDPYVINTQMANIGASAKFALFGDFSYYWLRDVKQVSLMQLRERYAEYLQVGFLVHSRHGGYLTNSAAVKHAIGAAGSA